MLPEGDSSELQTILEAFRVLRGAIDELKDDALTELRRRTMNQIIECGVIIQRGGRLNEQVGSMIDVQPDAGEEVEEAVASLRQEVGILVLELVGEKLSEFLEYLKGEIDLSCARVAEYCTQARQHFRFVFDFARDLQLSMRMGEGDVEASTGQPGPLAHRPEEDEEARDIIHALKEALERERMHAESAADRSEVHSLAESLRLASEFLDSAERQDGLTDQILAAFRCIARAHASIMQVLQSVYDARAEIEGQP